MRDEKYKVIYASFEAAPFFKTGGLGDVAGSLPAALQRAGADVRVMLPRLAALNADFAARLRHVADFCVPLGWRQQYCGIEELKHQGVTYYFIDNEYYFKREQPYGYGDDAERIAFFSKAILEALQHLPGFFPDILHCNDWHTALCPVFLREQYMQAPGYDRLKTVFSVHNLKFQGVFGGDVLGDILGLHESAAARGQLMTGDCINYLRGAACYSDRLLTVSPTYAEEICTPACGEGLEEIFCRRRGVLRGILNGINTAEYDPAHDTQIPAQFSTADMAGKAVCKRELQQRLGLAVRDDVPLAVLVSRLTEQKGIDLLLHILPELLGYDIQVAVLGVGEPHYEQAFRHFAAAQPDKFACSLTFSDALAHQFYAGADMLLMPSRFEPCGLSQMIAMRYGALPVVRETGGLKDSVQPYNCTDGSGNGFSFANYNAHELLYTLQAALRLWRQPGDWQRLAAQAMATDNSWQRSAGEYMAVYRGLLAE